MGANRNDDTPRTPVSPDRARDASATEKNEPNAQAARARRRRLSLFVPVAIAWVLLDQVTKAYFNGAFFPGQVITDPIAGIFRFHLVYNTGGAWSIFSGATWALGAFSLVVCIALSAYTVISAPESLPAEAVGLGLVVAGGLGNAIDRFALGYVVDFIEPTFIEFPVFNIADIGVTCGFVVFFVALFLRERAKATEGGA